MERFDFTDIIKRIEAAKKYKTDNYYTNYFNHPIDEYNYMKETISVEDWNGLKGKMTLIDFARYIGVKPETVLTAFEKNLQGKTVDASVLRKFRTNFKKIDFNMEDLI